MSRAGWSSPTPPKRHANGASKPPNVSDPRHTKAALAWQLVRGEAVSSSGRGGLWHGGECGRAERCRKMVFDSRSWNLNRRFDLIKIWHILIL